MPRVLPSAPEAEASLLGTMIIYPKAVQTAMEEGLEEDDFFTPANRTIFLAIKEMYRKGMKIDPSTVSTTLRDMNLLDHMGGIEYLGSLEDAAVTSANTKEYVTVIHAKTVIRNMIEAASKITEDGLNGQADVNDYLDQAEKSILDVSRNRRAEEFRDPQELMNNVLTNIHKMSENKSDITGYKTGYRILDHNTHGFQKGDFLVLAARPSMGKTAVALNLAMNVATYNPSGAVAIFSLEMAAEQLVYRMLGAKSHLTLDKLKTGRLNDEEWNTLNETATELTASNIYIDDTPGIKMPEIFSKCRRLQAEHGLNLVVIDYIQLITGSNSHSSENRQQEVSNISRSLKELARELKVPVLALSQLSRSVEQREGKKPMLSDLRESGAIEQDADIVMMLFRQAYYDAEVKEAQDKTGMQDLEINVAKNRNGSVGTFTVAFEPVTNAIYNKEQSSIAPE